MTDDIVRFIDRFGMYRRSGTLPEAGGSEDQTASFDAARRILEARIDWIEANKPKTVQTEDE